jgi:hypothetical protein
MKPNPYFHIMDGDGLFPLTPALSPEEREKRSQLFGGATADFCTTVYEFYKNFQRLFPLPRERVRVRGRRADFCSKAILKTH